MHGQLELIGAATLKIFVKIKFDSKSNKLRYSYVVITSVVVSGAVVVHPLLQLHGEHIHQIIQG
jgi:hypothetical protein